ncbi:MAG: ATPase [Salibacteraceae bacterium]
MKCIADSGSTKTTWVLLDEAGKELARTSTIGLNPFFVDSDEIAEVTREALNKLSISADIERLFFYGAGCSSEKRKEMVRKGIAKCRPQAAIEVDHDLLAAARAACKTSSGIACILGTGSNSCEYDGVSITDNIPALGFMAGDEGSGSAIGRRLIQGWLYREMPSDLAQSFIKEFDLTKENTLHRLYYEPKPNRFMASLAGFCGTYQKHDYIQNILSISFLEFIDRHILKYTSAKSVPIHFIGSIAYYYQNELKACLEQRDLAMGLLIRDPINQLIEFHGNT